MCGWAAVGTHRGLGTSSCYLPWVPTVKLLQTIHWALLSNRVGTAVVPGGSLLGSLGVKVGIVRAPSVASAQCPVCLVWHPVAFVQALIVSWARVKMGLARQL